MTANIDAIKDQARRLRLDIEELESHFDHWDSGSTAGGKKLRSIAKRIIFSAKRLEALVHENTYTP